MFLVLLVSSFLGDSLLDCGICTAFLLAPDLGFCHQGGCEAGPGGLQKGGPHGGPRVPGCQPGFCTECLLHPALHCVSRTPGLAPICGWYTAAGAGWWRGETGVLSGSCRQASEASAKPLTTHMRQIPVGNLGGMQKQLFLPHNLSYYFIFNNLLRRKS